MCTSNQAENPPRTVSVCVTVPVTPEANLRPAVPGTEAGASTKLHVLGQEKEMEQPQNCLAGSKRMSSSP